MQHIRLLLLVGLLALQADAQTLDQPLGAEQFQACVQDLSQVTDSALRPLKRDDFLRIAADAHYDDRVRQSMQVAAGEPTYWWDELAATTDAQRVADGQRVIAQNADVLNRIEARFGVPKEIVVAIYGIETNYGPAGGRIPVLDAAMSLACLRPCPPDTGQPGKPATCRSRERAFAAVRLLRDNKVRRDDFVGSWAAAFGRTQFVPDTLEQVGVDFDGDGVVDVVGSDADAWASTANHLKTRGGWIAGAPVWIEVSIPPDQQAAFAGKGDSIRQQDQIKPLSAWAAQGWRGFGPNGESVPLQRAGDPEVYPFLPVGLPGPAFLVTRNFNTILRYNGAERYVMEVSLLAHKIAGGRDFWTPWPTDDPGLSRAQVKQFQQWLVDQGHADVVPDGVQGRKTRDAIAAEFEKRGLPPQRRVGQRTMAMLMSPP
ncbi:lytic murein transglycosylase [Ramlibacter sp. G-1-2-2]|uniref:Lytic murein transglycosylase n=1 Tax=Ramlibacter agri TaxID=2728837 RepID=A0A848H352_9BURK|nr:lytic murein transglycosylase [Ramlibacter agri]